MSTLKHLSFALAAAAAQCLAARAAEPLQLSQVGRWQNITSFSVDAQETHIVFSVLEAEGRERIYEVQKQNGGWSREEPIAAVNAYDLQAQVGGVCLSPDGHRLFFHANYKSGKGGYDIYYVDRTADGWSEPQIVEGVSSAQDEMFPSLTPGESQIWFMRPMAVGDFLNFRQDAQRMQIYVASKNEKNQWSRAVPASPLLNMGYSEDAVISAAGHDVFFAQRADKKEPAAILHSHQVCPGVWTEPQELIADGAGYDYFNAQMVGNTVYFLRSVTKKRLREGYIVAGSAMGIEGVDKATQEEVKIVDAKSLNPLSAKVELVDAITGGVVSSFVAGSDGRCLITAAMDRDMILRVSRDGYTEAEVMLTKTDKNDRRLPAEVKLWGSVSLKVNVSDGASFAPAEAKVVAVRTDKTVFRSEQTGGSYVVDLPVGADYHVIVTAANYAQADFNVNLTCGAMCSQLVRDVALEPLRKQFALRFIDNETRQPIAAQVLIASQRERVSHEGQRADVLLRKGDTYRVGITARGYVPEGLTISVGDQTDDKVVSLLPLSKGLVRAVEGISFAAGTAIIDQQSIEAIESIARMLRDNEGVVIEIAAGGEGDTSLGLQRARALAERISTIAGGEPRAVASATPTADKTVRYTVVKTQE